MPVVTVFECGARFPLVQYCPIEGARGNDSGFFCVNRVYRTAMFGMNVSRQHV